MGTRSVHRSHHDLCNKWTRTRKLQTAALARGRTLPQAPIHLHVNYATVFGGRAARAWDAPRKLGLAIPSVWLRRCARIPKGRYTADSGAQQQGLHLPSSNKEGR
eukprot:4190063-Pyramimonas_sp.AAC.1